MSPVQQAVNLAHVPRVADGPFIAECSCGWRLSGQPENDGSDEWLLHMDSLTTPVEIDRSYEQVLAAMHAIVVNELPGVSSWQIGLARRLADAALAARAPKR